MSRPEAAGGWRLVALRWLPASVVALGAAVATAHGLYEVATAAGVPKSIAWLYPLITDGLAMVAYAATAKLVGRAGGYAWSVVVLTAALSGLGQAAYLAADDLQADVALRLGVGAWPAVAIALVAHLLHLLGTSTGPSSRIVVDTGELAPPPATDAPGDGEQHERDADESPNESGVPVDPRVADLARRWAAGEQLTGSSVAAELACSERTGRRLIADARTHLDAHPELAQDAPAAHLGLHLVEQTGGTA